MNFGKTLFAQVMEYVPCKTFGRIIERHSGDAGVRTLSCADLFRVMAFAQLTWRESLRDIEVCLAANQAKLFHMGLKGVPARSTLSDALNLRDWRIIACGKDIRLEVDGGIKVDNIRRAADAGADTFVAGSAIFGQPEYRVVIDRMRAALR